VIPLSAQFPREINAFALAMAFFRVNIPLLNDVRIVKTGVFSLNPNNSMRKLFR
jgi:hypothetical protein